MDKRIAIFPGSFDPITKGHENILRRALPLFDEIIIAIGINSNKQSYFPIEQRQKWIKYVFENEPKVRIESYTGLTIEFCKKINAHFILRGLRTSADFEFEKSIAQNNKVMAPQIETIFILPIPELSAINSTIVRDIIRNGGDASPFVPKGIDLKAM
ncbi:MAG: pantetheine-phosphate adenylyltransferase [Bacteroidetes bacterium]|nr:pantetheine-phosphate adenylyltransferase [Bacteroidota bacterium]